MKKYDFPKPHLHNLNLDSNLALQFPQRQQQ